MELKNTYNADTYVEKIKDTEFFKKLQEDYDEIIIDLYNKKL